MSSILKELDRLPLKEIEKKLKKNNYVGPGAIVIHASKRGYKAVYTVKARIRSVIYIYKDGMSSSSAVSYSDYRPFTFEDYLKYREAEIAGLSPRTAEQVNTILTKLLHRLFKPENIEIRRPYEDTFEFTIYFPSLVVKNSLGMEHEMREIYLTFPVYFYGARVNPPLTLGIPTVFRGAYTVAEWRSKYVFSHISTNPGQVGVNWCFGSTIVNTYMNRYNSNLPILQLSSFLLAFISYLQWESIEGVPYRHLTALKKFHIEPIEEGLLDVDPYYKELLKKLPSFDYTYITEDGEASVEILPEGRAKIAEVLGTIIADSGNTDLLGISEGTRFGKPISHPVPSQESIDAATTPFKFKGETIKVSVIPDVEVESEDFLKTMHLHPSVNYIVINRLEESLLEHIIKYKLDYE